jgi:hypothetical protein
MHTRDLSTTGDNKPSDVMTALTDTYLAVEAKKLPANAFVQSVESVDWRSMEASELASVMQLALQLEMIPLVRRLIARATPEQMEDALLKKLKAVVSPGRVISTTLPPNPKINASTRWYGENAHQYVGKWIALDGGLLLGVADTLDDLEKMIDNHASILITQVV